MQTKPVYRRDEMWGGARGGAPLEWEGSRYEGGARSGGEVGAGGGRECGENVTDLEPRKGWAPSLVWNEAWFREIRGGATLRMLM